MRIKLFYHSLVSDWNHGNAHFLRGITRELLARGHQVEVFEPEDGWSLANLRNERGQDGVAAFRRSYPELESRPYRLTDRFVDEALRDADLVLVHEWNEPALVKRIGEHRAKHDYLLLFHDTHHRVVTRPEEMQRYDLSCYDAVLAFGEVLRRMYLERGLAARAFTWHEAADSSVFYPKVGEGTRQGLVWIGNWGDGERTRELSEYLFDPVASLALDATVYGVRYPEEALATLQEAGIRYGGFLPNSLAPEVFARHALTVHVPRRPYVEAMVGVPTIRVFEALACGIPLVSAPWEDAERLFEPNDFLLAQDGRQMTHLLRTLLHEPGLRAAMAARGLATVRARHTCAHRVDELLAVCAALRARAPRELMGGLT
jgi:spore maturation protein CgeB